MRACGCRCAESLLYEAKNHLNITWADQATDDKIRGLILLGMAYLDDKSGAPADCSEPGYAKMLLFEYVRYARDEALDVFENNYRQLLLAMRDQQKVASYVEKTEQAEP